MTTTQTDNDAKKLGGYLKEKFTIAMTRFSDDELVRAVTKVTSHMLKIPNEKHMQRLINATYGQFNSGGTEYPDVNKWIVENLESHLHAHNWVVVLKTALAFHRLMQDGSDAFNGVMQLRRGLFSLSAVKDLADSPDGAEQQIFCTHYLRYLEERQIAQNFNHARMKGMRIENQTFANQLLSITGREAVTVTSALLLQFETAIDVQFIAHAVNNFATLQGHRNCLNDAKLLFVAISRKMVNILEKIEDMTPEEREAWLPIYKRYSVSSRKFAGKLNEMKTSRVSWGEALPTIRPLPDDILEQLAAMLDPKYTPSNLGAGELPRAKLSDITKANNNSNNGNDNDSNPPILDGKVIMGDDNDNMNKNNNNNNKIDSNKAMHDIFSPDFSKGKSGAAAATAGSGASAAGGMPDLFSNGPTKPVNNNNNKSVDNKTVDLFGDNSHNNNNNNNNGGGLAPPPNRTSTTTQNKNNFDDLFGGAPSTNNNNNNNSNQNQTRSAANTDLFGSSNNNNHNNNNSNNNYSSYNNNSNNNNSNQNHNNNNNNNVPAHNDLFGSSNTTYGSSQNNYNSAPKAHTLPADPFASINNGTPSTSSPSSSSPSTSHQQQQSSSTSNQNNSNFVDFFAPSSNNNNNNNNNNQNRNSNPAFDPFAPSGRAW